MKHIFTNSRIQFGLFVSILPMLLLPLSSMLLLPLSSTEARPAQAQPSYALQQKNADGGSVILRVYDRNTDRTIWRRRCIGPYAPTWSQDHRSFAVVIKYLYGHPSTIGQFRLLYWRAGEAVCLVGHPRLFQDFDEVGDDMKWSPDGRRFAFRGGGLATTDGTLCCVDAETGHFYFGPSGVDRFSWDKTHGLRYWLAPRIFYPNSPYGSVDRSKQVYYWSGKMTDSR